MNPFDDLDPHQFIGDFYEQFGRAVTESDADLASVVDGFHTPDVIQVADGHVMDRDRLIAHVRPTRKQQPTSRIEVQEAMVEGDRLAARYRMHVQRPRRDRVEHLLLDVHFFGQFAPDRRLRRAHMLTRMEREPTTPGAPRAPHHQEVAP